MDEVDVGVRPGPGVVLLHGGNSSGKTLLMTCLRAALDGSGPLEVEFDGPSAEPGGATFHSGRQGPTRDLPPDVDTRLRGWRRVMGYGQPDGSLLMPLIYEGGFAQKVDPLGAAMLECATNAPPPGSWPGIVIDNAFTGMTKVAMSRFMDVVARLAMHRQVVLGCMNEHAKFVEFVCSQWGVTCLSVALNEGRAVCRLPYVMDIKPDSTVEATGPR